MRTELITTDILLIVAVGALSIVMAILSWILTVGRVKLRISIVMMGLLSVLLIAGQAVRTMNSQEESWQQVRLAKKACFNVNAALIRAQAEIRAYKQILGEQPNQELQIH
jgi:hypothetical protein